MNLEGQTVVVTGASGFIGRYMIETLVEHSCNVIAVTRAPFRSALNVKVVVTDYSRKSINAFMGEADAVIHLGGRRMMRTDDPHDLEPFLDANVSLVGRLIDAAIASGVSRFLLASTIAVYSQDDPMPYQENARTHPLNAYALSKKFAEDYMEQKTKSATLETAALRLSAIYGDGERDTPALMKFVGRANRKQVIKLTGDANYCIDELYVKDAVSAFVAALRAPKIDGIYNVGSGRALTVGQIAETVNDVFGNTGNLDLSASSASPVQSRFMDTTRASEELEWIPGYSLAQGLKDLRSIIQADAEKQNG